LQPPGGAVDAADDLVQGGGEVKVVLERAAARSGVVEGDDRRSLEPIAEGRAAAQASRQRSRHQRQRPVRPQARDADRRQRAERAAPPSPYGGTSGALLSPARVSISPVASTTMRTRWLFWSAM